MLLFTGFFYVASCLTYLQPGGRTNHFQITWLVTGGVLAAVALHARLSFVRRVRFGNRLVERLTRVDLTTLGDVFVSKLGDIAVFTEGERVDPAPGNPLRAVPYAITWQEGKKVSQAIVVPGAVVARLLPVPEQLLAVLLHERAHVRNNDIRVLHAVQVVVTGSLFVFGAAILARFVDGAWAYSVAGLSVGDAVRAASLDKAGAVTGIAGLVLIALLRIRLYWYQEALADVAAVAETSRDILRTAVSALTTRDEHDRLARVDQVHALRAIDAAVIGALISFAGGRFAALAGSLSHVSSLLGHDALYMVALISVSAVPACFLAMYLASASRRDTRVALARLAVALVAYAAYESLIAHVPEMLQQRFAVEGVDFYPYDFPRYLVANALRVAADGLWLAILAVAGATLARHFQRGRVAVVPAVVWAACLVVENLFVGEYSLGGVTLVGTGTVLVVAAVLSVRDRCWPFLRTLLLASGAYLWFAASQYAEVWTPVYALRARASLEMERGDLPEAERYLSLVVCFPGDAEEYIYLDQVRSDLDDRLGALEAIKAGEAVAERQGELPAVLRTSIRLAHALRVTRNDGAETYFAKASALLRYSFFTNEDMTEVYAEGACIAAAHRDEKQLALRLTRAVNYAVHIYKSRGVLSPAIASMLDDDDLQAMAHSLDDTLSEEDIDEVRAKIRGLTYEELERMVLAGQVNARALIAYLLSQASDLSEDAQRSGSGHVD